MVVNRARYMYVYMYMTVEIWVGVVRYIDA